MKTSFLYTKAEFFLLFIFVSLSVIKIDKPGVNTDQLLFVNAAIGPLDSSYIYKAIHGIPVLIMIYIGALKAYLFKPIFYLFGVSIYSIRLPIIVIMTFSLYLLHKCISLVDKKIAIFTLIILATDPSFIAFSRIDYGPVVLEFFFKVISLLFFYYLVNTKKQKYLLLLLASLALGLFNKTNFIWFINSLLFATVFIFRHEILEKKRFISSKQILIIFVSYISFLFYGFWIYRKATVEYSAEAISLSFSKILNNTSIVTTNFINLINGESLFRLIYNKPLHEFATYYSYVLILIVILGVFYIIKNRKQINNKFTRFNLFILMLTICVFVQLSLTSIAFSAWHTYSIYPFFAILIAISLTRIRFSYLLVSAIVLYNLFSYYKYISYYDKPVSDLKWSSQFYELVKFTDSFSGLVLSTDVGIQANFLAFSNNYSKYTPIEWMVDIQSYESYKSVLQGYFKKDSNILVVVPNNESVIFKGIQPYFVRFIKDYRINLIKIREFKDGDKIAYTVYKVK